MKIFLLITSLLFISFASFADEEITHIVVKGNSVSEKLSKLKMQSTLIESAKEFERYGQVARVTHHDMAYPKDRDEYIKAGGFGVLWVTSHSQLKSELPIKNFRISIENIGTMVLKPIYSFTSNERNKFVAKILGGNRTDVIYMIPFFEEMKGATLLADYSANRKDFILGHIEDEYPVELGTPFNLPTQLNYPDLEIFNVMLKREYPIAKDLIRNSELLNRDIKLVELIKSPK